MYLLLFFSIAYALAWLAFAVPILAARGLMALPAPEAVFLTIATLGICLAALAVAVLESGTGGVRALLAQVVRWRVTPRWYVAAILGPALFPVGAVLFGVVVGDELRPTFSSQ